MAVGITLETIAAPGATPIANNAASSKSFANNYAKLAVPNLSTQDRKGIFILGMIYALTAAGGANYKSAHKALIQDAAVYTRGILPLDIWAAFAGTTASAAKVADASFSLDVPTETNEARDIIDLPEATQDKIMAFLAAQLGI